MTKINNFTIKLGTRASLLALWQANMVKKALEKNGFNVEILPIITKGDKILNVSLSKIGSKGVFTEELETQLRNKDVDIVVHSAKDIPSEIDKDLKLIAFGRRELAQDVLVGQKIITITKLQSQITENQVIKIGTSSTRRVAFIHKFFPDVTTVQVRGNLQTRINKMVNGDCDYLMLAYAGIMRMEEEALIQLQLPINMFTPPAGQGSIAIQSLSGIDVGLEKGIRECFNDKITEQCIIAERQFLHYFKGGCSVPIFVHATIDNNKTLNISGGIISLEGDSIVRASSSTHEFGHIKKCAHSLAQEVSEKGGKEILEKIKKQML